MRTTTEVFQDHLAKRLAGRTEKDITENYAQDVTLLGCTGEFTGHDGIRASSRLLDEQLPGATFRYRHTLVSGDYAFLEWTAENGTHKVPDGADSFVIKDGKIIFQSVFYSLTEKHDG